ncbi:MAG: hypothetical protein LUG93_16430 [Lachnospiraceae bacterium]|nr:hypothetical protein [Lachnospiraceae bacterium]
MGYYDGKGYWREDGEGGYDAKGYWREPGEGGYDSQGYWRNADEGGYDSEGYWRDAGEGGYDSEGYYRDGQHRAGGNKSDDSSSGGGCYITTACVEYKGLADDCHEMTVLRQFRDKLSAEDENLHVLMEEYYEKAPRIVERINADCDRDSILADIYENMVLKCVNLMESGNVEEGVRVYLDNFRALEAKYLTE